MFCQYIYDIFLPYSMQNIIPKVVLYLYLFEGEKMEIKKNLTPESTMQSNPALLFERNYHYIADSNKIPRYVVATVQKLLRYQGANEYCFPSLKTLARDLKVSVQTVLKHIRILKEAGVLKVVQQVREDGGWGNNRYYLKTDFLSWVTQEMLEDESRPYYKAYYDELTANSSADADIYTEKEIVHTENILGTANANIYDAEFVEEQYRLSELRADAKDDSYTTDLVDLMEDILLDVLNASDDKLFNVKSLKPAIVVKSVFLKMNKFNILATLRKFADYLKSGKEVKYSQKCFLISMLYNNFLKSKEAGISFDLTGQAAF